MSSPEALQQPAPALEDALAVRDLRIVRRSKDAFATIVSSLALSVGVGETVGIVGESGSGKSMTARAITGLLPRNVTAEGEVLRGERELLSLSEREWGAVRGHDIGLILQDPFTMLNPVMRCGRILQESIRSEARRRTEWRVEAARRLAEVGITDESVVDRYPFQLSGGMRQRVAIAAALARDPRILIADEPSTALDVTTQREILALIKRIQEARRMSLLLITHDLRVAFSMCDRIYVLYAGSIVEVAPAAQLESEPLHPYTLGLLLSEPSGDQRVKTLSSIPGSVPEPDDVVNQCTFAGRCRWASRECYADAPSLEQMAEGGLSACARISEIRNEMSAARERAEAHVESLDVTPVRSDAALIQVTDVRKSFGGRGGITTALNGVTIQVDANESVGVVGESGSGKTTLARLLVGLESVSDGSITIDGIDASDWSRLNRRSRHALRGTIQIVFQDPYSSLNPMRTIGWTLSEAITTHSPSARRVREQVTELLELVGLSPMYADRRPVALSGGERQRVAIARALAAQPRILICDEPVSALDVSVQAQILNLFMSLRAERKIGYLFITHDLSIVRQISDYLYVMRRGEVVEAGVTGDVLGKPSHPYTVELLRSVPRGDDDWLAG